MNSPAPRLILASRSPRRLDLLREAGFSPVQMDPPFNDPPQPAHGDPVATALDLARQKALSLANAIHHDGDVIVSADTIVVTAQGLLLGQARDAQDARAMLLQLIGKEHRVVTAVAVVRVHPGGAPEVEAFYDTTRVVIGQVPAEELDRYLATDAWRGKAGAYNLAELQGRWPIQFTGDPTTVVGLPLQKLLPILRRRAL